MSKHWTSGCATYLTLSVTLGVLPVDMAIKAIARRIGRRMSGGKGL